MQFDDATRAQNRASDPFASTWLSANAGSGKTKVLTDRVARLLLRGVAPQRILCLTYTKAAASEMQNRLFALLGTWAMLPEDKLRAALAAIEEDARSPAHLAEARRLFARAIEAPGGLKIQTIHSFCAALLRRFPLEAGLSPAFREMDARASTDLRAAVLDDLAEGAGQGALAALAEVVGGTGLDALLAEICAQAPRFGAADPEQDLAQALDLPAGFEPAQLLAEVFLGDEASLIASILPALEAGSKNDVKDAEKLRAIPLDAPDLDTLAMLEGVLLTKSGANPFTAKIGKFPTKDTRAALGPLLAPLDALMARVEAARPRRLGLGVLIRSRALHRFARAFLPAYARAKSARGWLDFDDLIIRTGQVLTDPAVAQWVLFKLDGGVDHILVDEAQDTSPGQWRVIEHLAQEFTSGLGARDASRTLFVVGDKKQSIYSFQGADLAVFDDMQTQFRTRLADVGLRLNEAVLEHSFRSSDAVLRSVDTTFRPPNETGLGGAPQHLAFHAAMPGRVDLWPAIAPPDKPSDPEWYQPVDILSEEHHHRQLARQIAQELRRMIDARTLIPHRDGPRPMTEGDVLILVRRRNTLFDEIILACKAEGLQIAGADQLRLGGEMAVRDLLACLAVLATPEDDLALACSLRSPLFGWSEDALYRLAQGRGSQFLWERLRESDAPETLAILHDLRRQTDFLRPFDLIERILTRHDGRRRLIGRLGVEAEDGIDALLAQALAYEATGVPSLTGFLAWMEQGDVTVKRELGSADQRLRVMTVHGAKGLESPVVILPDTAEARQPERRQLYPLGDTLAWRAGRAEDMPASLGAQIDHLADLRAQEDARLLYVAMTRAESWLIVAAAGKVAAPGCWHARVAEGLTALDALPQPFPTGEGLRHQHQPWPSEPPIPDDPRSDAPPASAPDWLWQPAPPPPAAPRLRTPSQLGGAKVLPGDAPEAPEADALARGTHLHLLLEHLPGWPREIWARGARDLLAALEDPPLDADALFAEAQAILDAPDLAPLFRAPSMAEVEITADLAGQPLFGVIDRLIPHPDRVLAIDYKSNRRIPSAPDQVPEGLLRQMGAYRAALAQVFPGREIEVALLWTAAPRLMLLPSPLVDAALARGVLETCPAGE